MAVLYLHIGMPKTGTTALQDFLHHNPQALEKQGAVYPDFGVEFARVSRSRNAYWLTRSGYSKEIWESCFRRINTLADSFHTILLSDEVLWNAVAHEKEFWERIRGNLREDIELKLLVYIRRQDEYVHSWWAQQVKAHQHYDFDVCTFPEFLSEKAFNVIGRHLDYQHYFQTVMPVLGKENVVVRAFERGQFYDEDLYADYLHTVGLELTDDFTKPDALTNISIRGNVLEAKRILNHMTEFTQVQYRLIPYLEKAQLRMADEGKLVVRNDFPQAERLKMMETYAASNEWVARELLDRQDGILFYEPVKADREAKSEYTQRETADACGYMMLAMMDEISLEKRRRAEAQEELRRVRSSRLFRIGRALTGPARTIRKCFNRK